MKAVILCGGKGLRMGGDANVTCKPLAKVGGIPILYHIMTIYKKYQIKEFILCLGFRGDAIKDYFVNMDWKNNDFRLKTEQDSKKIEFINQPEDLDIIFADTGLESMTGARIKKIRQFIDEDEFMLTYGDAVSDINIDKLLAFHRQKGKIATVTGIKTKSGYGALQLKDGIAVDFKEKPLLADIINAGFFVLNKKVFEYIPDEDLCVWEEEPLKKLVQDQELAVYEHQGFWHSMDTLKDLQVINDMWDKNIRPWL